MDVTVALEHRFARTPDGAVWTESFFASQFWKRYLAVFDGVRVVSRVRNVDRPEDGWHRVDGPGVAVTPLPYYVGPTEYLRRRAQVIRAARAAIRRDSAVILRVSSQIANCLESALRRTTHPFGVEVVADPYYVFAPGAIRHPLRPFLRWWFPRRLRGQCLDACAASYVTRDNLQSVYPAGPRAFQTYYSSVELGPDAFVEAPRIGPRKGPLHIVFAGTLEVYYKGPDILIDALTECRRQGLDFQLTMLGDGRRRREIEARIAAEGLQSHVHLAGLVPGGEAVRRYFDSADLFVLPSFQEGLPRAMIEAMARGLPCIGTTVGGIPELLPGDCMVPAGNAAALAAKIREAAGNPAWLRDQSKRNLATAFEYREELLNQRRSEFYRHVRDATNRWLGGAGS
jgi:glycosyltransferase involved in cell wall biosynthesis